MDTSIHDNLVEHWSKNNSLLHKYSNNEELIEGSKKLAKKIANLNPQSVFEVGMYNGRNLYYLHELLPDIKIGGIDVNSTALASARSILPEDTEIIHGDALYMDTDKKYDIVFTHGVLMHISPETIGKVINNCISKASKFVVHVERKESNNYILRGPEKYSPERVDEQLRWCPNVASMYKTRRHRVIIDKKAHFGSTRSISRFVVVELQKE